MTPRHHGEQTWTSLVLQHTTRLYSPDGGVAAATLYALSTHFPHHHRSCFNHQQRVRAASQSGFTSSIAGGESNIYQQDSYHHRAGRFAATSTEPRPWLPSTTVNHGLSLRTTIRDNHHRTAGGDHSKTPKPSPPPPPPHPHPHVAAGALHSFLCIASSGDRTALPPPASPLFHGGVAAVQCHALALPVSTGRRDEPSAGGDHHHHPIGFSRRLFFHAGPFQRRLRAAKEATAA